MRAWPPLPRATPAKVELEPMSHAPRPASVPVLKSMRCSGGHPSKFLVGESFHTELLSLSGAIVAAVRFLGAGLVARSCCEGSVFLSVLRSRSIMAIMGAIVTLE